MKDNYYYFHFWKLKNIFHLIYWFYSKTKDDVVQFLFSNHLLSYNTLIRIDNFARSTICEVMHTVLFIIILYVQKVYKTYFTALGQFCKTGIINSQETQRIGKQLVPTSGSQVYDPPIKRKRSDRYMFLSHKNVRLSWLAGFRTLIF